MTRHQTLDVRAMEPPEPLERTLQILGSFMPGDTLTLIINCRPVPLFRLLERDGYQYRVEPGVESVYRITIAAPQG